MKRITRLISVIMAALLILPLYAFGYPSYVVQNPDVQMPYNAPTVDGVIEQDGSWSSAAYLNDATCGHFWATNPLRSTANLYFAYDNNALYFAAEVTDPAFIASTGVDNVDNSGSSRPYGWNGDVMALMLDAQGRFETSSYQTTPWYDVGIYADGSVHVYRANASAGDITSQVQAAGAVTSSGWRFEIAVPWSVIIADMRTASSNSLSTTVAAVRAKGAVSRAAAMYMDRYKNGSSTTTWGRYITVCEKTHDGYKGTDTPGTVARAYGLNLVCTGAAPHNWGEWTVTKAAGCTESGSRTRTCLDCGETETETLQPLGHIWSAWSVAKQPTETETGLRRRECSRCGEEETAIIAATGNGKPIIVAYYNASQSTVNEFTNIDVLNYHPAYINTSYPSTNPITHLYSSSVSSFRTRVARQNPDAKILFTLASNNLQVFESWMTSAEAADRMADNIVNIVKTYNFDGVDIDYEFPTVSGLSTDAANAKKASFVYLMTAIRDRLTELGAQTGKDYLLTMAVPGTVWSFSLFDMLSLQEQVDWFNIMNYDTYANRGYALHHTSPYDNSILAGGSVASDIVAYQTNGIRPEKIVPGCGLYARRWTNVAPGPNGDGLYQSGTIDMNSSSAYIHYTTLLDSYVNKGGYVRYWDESAKAPYLYSSSAGTFLSYDDEESVGYKCDLVASAGVRGIMVFDYCTCDGVGLFDAMRARLDGTTHAHQYTSEVTTLSSCTEPGVRTYTCTICGESYTEPEPPLGHDYRSAVTTAPGCTEEGVRTYTCRRCGDSYTAAIAAVGHSYQSAVTAEPGCEEDGVRTFTCTRCGDEYTESIPALGHEWTSEVTDQPDCGESGVTTFTCTRCGEEYFEEIPALGHEYTSEITEQPTCTEPGVRTFTCVRGDHSYTAEEPALGHNYSSMISRMPSCAQEGLITSTCTRCGDVQTTPIAALAHTWGEWEVTREPSADMEGERSRTCKVCGSVETEPVEWVDPDKPALSVEGFVVSLTGAESINYIRYAPGVYTTTAELRAADGLVQLDAKTIARYTSDGVFSRELPASGRYTFWVRLDDGRTYFIDCVCDPPEPYVTVDGITITVHDIENIRDIFYAKGNYKTYREVANNAVMNVTYVKIGGAHRYSYAVAEQGDYTLCIRYADGTQKFLYANVTVDAPVISTFGLTVTVGNIADLKVLRAAPGEYATSGEVKRAAGVRNFTAATTGGKESYTAFFAAEGVYTLAVQYKNGYIEIHKVTLTKPEPTVELSAGGVTFGGLDGLQIIRWAPGEYSSIGEVKRAAGNGYIKAASITDGRARFDGLDGIYTFALQYKDLTVSLHVLELTTEEEPMLDIQNKRQLFAEQSFIDESLTTAARTVHSPEKKEQVFNFNAAWETTDTVYQNIVKLPEGGYRMYYKATADSRRIAYIESRDGLTWTRPQLSTWLYNGQKTNCVTDGTSSPDNLFVFYDTNANCEEGKRWKGIYGQWGDGLFLEWTLNDDGKYFPFWLNGETPYESPIYGAYDQRGKGSELSGGCFFDSLNTMYWDEARGKYVAFVRGFHEGDQYQLTADYVNENPAYITRDIRYAESADGVTWTTPVPLNYSDGDDWQMYANAITPYERAEGLYVGIPTRYNVTSTSGSSVTGAYTDNMFMVSRDLVNWTRYDVGGYMLAHDGSQKPLIYGDSYPCVGMIETSPGELSLYMKEKASGTSFEGRTVLYRYTLRTDGFASMSDGAVTTLPLTFNGSSLLVNYKAEAGGSLVVKITSGGKTYTSAPLTGDEIDGTVVFDGLDLASLAGKTVRVTFELNNAEIYSFKFE